jgi:hypothetical protein
MKRLLLACLLLLVAVRAFCDPAPDAFKIRFGIIEDDPKTGAPQIRETTTIPMKLESTGFRFGFAIETPDKGAYSFRFVTQLPSAPERLSGGLAEKNPGKPTATVNSPTLQIPRGGGLLPLTFDPGDPLGKWKIELFIEGQPAKTIEFTVVRPED